MIARVSVPQLRDWWPLVADWLGDAVEHDGLHTLASTRQEIACGDASLWLVFETRLVAACVSAVRDLPNGRLLSWALAGGTGAERWFGEMDARLTREAQEHGCAKMIAYGRRGWAPVAKPFCWSPQSTIFAKDVPL